jgi:uncharacterized repeat protein (TIGR02543 family)
MGGSTSQKSRRRIDSYLYKCSNPRLFVSQNISEPITYVQIKNGIICPWSTLYGSTKCSTDNVIIDYTIKVYNSNNQITYQSSDWTYATDPSSYYFLGNTALTLVNGGRITFTVKARREGYIDSDTVTATIYSSKQKLVLNVSPVSNTTFNGTVGTCTMDTGEIDEGVTIRYYHSVSSIEMPEAPIAPTQSTGYEYSGGISIGSNGYNTTYHAITAKAFATNGTDYEESDPVTVYYTYNATTPDAPIISPNSGTYDGSVEVTITAPSSYCDVRYTLDGTNPTTSSMLYTGPFILSDIGATITVKAISQITGTNIVSGVSSKTYTIQLLQEINVGHPTSVTSNSAVFHGSYTGPYSIDAEYTGFLFKKDSDTTWRYAMLQENPTQTSTGYTFTGISTSYLVGNSNYYVKAYTYTSNGDYLESEALEFRTPGIGECSLFSISSSEQVEFGKINLTYFRIYSYPGTQKNAYINDAKQWGCCGDRTTFVNQWDYIGDKTYTIPTIIKRNLNSGWEDYNATATNNQAGSINLPFSGGRATSVGGEVVRDLFGWGTSGNGDRSCSPIATCYYPFCTSTTDSDYDPYGSNNTDLMESDTWFHNGRLWADWSQAISYPSDLGDPISGEFGGEDEQWDGGTRVSVNTRAFPGACKSSGHDYFTTRSSKTPSGAEWEYLLFDRQTSSGKRYAKGRIQTGTNQYVNGLIVFGDTFTHTGSISNANTASAPYSSNTITVEQWNNTYENGCMFLPAAGYRENTTVSNSNSVGLYWSRTKNWITLYKAYALRFDNSSCEVVSIERHYGGCVRLCGPANIQNRSGYNVTIRTKGLGTTTGDGYYNPNASCTVTATPQTGWQFLCWKENGETVSSSASYTFNINASRDLEAWFEEISYTISASTSPSSSASVTGTGTYLYGDMVTLTASTKPGYSFDGWTEGGVTVCSTPTYIFNCTSDRTLVASCVVSQMAITAESNPIGAATITGAGNYNSGATCQLTATPVTGYNFSKWTENGTQISKNNPFSFTVNEPRSIVAELSVNKYDVTTAVNPTGAGTVSGAQNNVRYGDNITLTATPGGNYSFVGWNKGQGISIVSTDNPWTFSVLETSQYTANFSKSQRTISASVSPTGAGSVSGAGNYDIGATCSLSATENPGYTFVNWTEGGSTVSSNNPYSFVVSVSRALVANFSQNNYTITTTAGTGGTASGGGTYHYGDSCTITGTPNTGYHFLKWSETLSDSASETTTNPYTFTVTRSATYQASFEINTYTISTSVDPSGGGTVSGAGSYTHGQSVTLTATPATNYNFSEWKKNGTQVSTSASYTFTANSSGTYTAVFTKNTYSIQTSVTPTGSATVTGAGTYEHGESCTLVATPDSQYNFTKWTKSGSSTSLSTNTSYTFNVTEAATYVANLTGKSYTITASTNDEEYGNVSGGGLKKYNTTCTLTATPKTGCHFVNWTEGGVEASKDATYTFTVTRSRTLVANFAINTYTVTLTTNGKGYGTVSGGGTFNHGEKCKLLATPNTGYHFVNWTEGGVVVSTDDHYMFDVTSDRTLVGNFARGYIITLKSLPAGVGRLTGAGTYNSGDSVTISASTPAGYTFTKWTKNGTQVTVRPTYTFTATESATYTAEFTPTTYNISVSADPAEGAATLTGAGTYNYGASVTLTATANTGYTFSGWSKNGMKVSTDASYTFTATASATYVAEFTPITYNISVSADPAAGAATLTGAGTYGYGDSVTLTASAATGYTFSEWTKNGNQVSTDASYTFTATESAAYVAVFTPVSYNISVSADPAAGGTVSGGGSIKYGTSCTVTAESNSGYTFVNWTEGGTQVSTSASYTFTVTGARTLVANFSQDSYTVTVSAVGGGTDSTVSGGGSYGNGESCTVTASAGTGYSFVNWTENNVEVSTSAIYQFNVTGSRTLMGNFAINTYTVSVSADPAAGGTAEIDRPQQSYHYDDDITLTATPNTGYVFAGWHEGNPVGGSSNS